MYCQNCGKYLPDTAKFCDDCGTATPLGNNSAETIAGSYNDYDHYRETDKSENGKRSYDEYYHIVDPKKSPRKVGFFGALILLFRNTFNFKGRSTRSEYCFAVMFFIIFVFAIYVIFENSGLDMSQEADYEAGYMPVGPGLFMLVMCMYIIVMAIPYLSLTVRRFHDIGRSGYYALTLYFFFPIILLCCIPSVSGNQWGPSAEEKEQAYYRLKGGR